MIFGNIFCQARDDKNPLCEYERMLSSHADVNQQFRGDQWMGSGLMWFPVMRESTVLCFCVSEVIVMCTDLHLLPGPCRSNSI